MNLFSPILRLFNIGSLSNPDRGYQVSANEKISTSSGASVSDERSLKISTVWGCVQLIANVVASLPLNVYKKTSEGREAMEDHFLVELIQGKPNQYMKARDFRLAMTVQLALWNNAYCEIMYSGDRPVALMPLRPGRMSPFITDDGALTYHYSTEKGVKVYAKKSILHFKGFGTDGIIGSGRNNYARESYGLTVAAEDYAASQFRNGGRPGGVLETDVFLTKDQRTQLRELYEGISAGTLDKNRLWILEGGFKYHALDFAADQMQMLATRHTQTSEICRFFGVPEVLINSASNSSSSWPASFEQQMLAFLTFTIQSYIDEWEATLVDGLLTRYERKRLEVDHDVSQLIKMDSQAKASYLSTLVQNGIKTRNEARKALKLPKSSDKGADELTVQTNLAKIDDLEKVNGNQRQSNTPVQAQIRQ